MDPATYSERIKKELMLKNTISSIANCYLENRFFTV